MAKISIKVDVPTGDFCNKNNKGFGRDYECDFLIKDNHRCRIFNEYLLSRKATDWAMRCQACKDREIKEAK